MAKPKATIRVMGDKKLSHELISKIVRILEEGGYDFSAPREYPMYKDKKNRKKENIDPSRTRLYISVY
ncbi:MAG: hypothetical protein Q6363_007355 [Candidatus Njordarchaeota archaeon]